MTERAAFILALALTGCVAPQAQQTDGFRDSVMNRPVPTDKEGIARECEAIRRNISIQESYRTIPTYSPTLSTSGFQTMNLAPLLQHQRDAIVADHVAILHSRASEVGCPAAFGDKD